MAKKKSMRDKAKKKAEKDQNRGGNFKLAIPEDAKQWTPKGKGPYYLDVIPYEVTVDTHPEVSKGELWYQRTFWEHYGLGESGKMSALCPRTINKPCPVCEQYKELANSDDEEDREAAKNIKPKEREIYNVIDLHDQDSGVQIFAYSWHLFGKALSEEINEGGEEEAGFAELEGGKTLKVGFRQRKIGEKGTPFWEVRKIDFVDREEDYDEDILQEAYDLDQLLIINSYKELQNMLYGLDEKEDSEEEEEEEEENSEEEEEEEEEEKPAKKKSGKKGKKSSSKDEDKKSSKKAGKKKSSPKKSGKKSSKEDEEDDDEKTSKRPGKKPGKKGKNKCPGDGTFGEDIGELDECEDCNVWTECQEEYEKNHDEED